MWKPNSDAKWGPNVHDIEQFFSYGYYGDYGYHHHHDDDSYCDQQQYNNATCYQYKNEMFHSLQYGLSELSLADGSESSSEVQEHLQVPPYPLLNHLQVSSNDVPEHLHASYPVDQSLARIPNPDWYYGPLSFNYYHGNEEEVTKQTKTPCPSSSPENQSYYSKENSSGLENTNESQPKRKVHRRLNEIITVAHTPKVNGEIPSNDEAFNDYQRLQNRLELYDMVEFTVEGDGNCQFRALSDQLYHTPDHHKSVRKRVLKQIKLHPEMYAGYVPLAYNEYLRQISKCGEWGDHVTLQAAADSYGVKILVLTSFKDTIFIEILPNVLKSKRVISLSYWAEVHYNSIYPEGELPQPEDEQKKIKKKWWNFKNKPQAYLE